MNIRIILALSTVTGITLGDLLARQAEAGASQNFSRYYTAQTDISAEEDPYQSPRKKQRLVKSSTLINESRPTSIFDLLNENETRAQPKSKKRRNSTAAPIKNQLSGGAARRAEIKKHLAAEAARQAAEKRKKPEEVFELFNDGELKSKSWLDDSMTVTVVDTDELKKRLAEKAARGAEIKKWLAAEVTLALEKQRQAETERQRLAVAESRTEASLTDAEPIPAGERVKVGERDTRVPMIRERMLKLGFLSEENSLAWMLGHPADKVSNPSDLEWILDKELSKAIKAFQKANGIEQSGRIDKATVAALNEPEAAAKQRLAEEERKVQEAALALEKQRQAEEAERQRLAAEAAVKQRQAEEERKAQELALALEKQRQAEEAERQRLAVEAAEKQRQAEEAERQRLAAEAAAKQQQAEEERKAQESALALEKQRKTEEAERLADKRKLASLDSASEVEEASSKSCNKAKSIVGKYGFKDIETKSCNGKIYNFSATREGKKFSIKINALTSELTEIRKILSSGAE